ncbi:MAG TPA: DUF6385 domain-containing protein [Lachnospiraceae bacterium]|nr:DUF6385 domain-containing protein [Lachnospiraceae bacterium]HEX3077343.1 DUF6385 domain-containing protein [Lachnospiraceae bacterium]
MNSNYRDMMQGRNSKMSCGCGYICTMQDEKIGQFYSTSYCIKLSSHGKAMITFDSSQFTLFTISVLNRSQSKINAHLELSPDGYHFNKDLYNSTQTIEPGEVRLFPGVIFIRYTAIVLQGNPCAEAAVYVQSQNIG